MIFIDYSIKELQIIYNFAKSEYKRTGIKEYYDIYTKYDLRLIEVHSYINGIPKLIENKSNNVPVLGAVRVKNAPFFD